MKKVLAGLTIGFILISIILVSFAENTDLVDIEIGVGNYVIGRDIEPGEYALILLSSNGASYSIEHYQTVRAYTDCVQGKLKPTEARSQFYINPTDIGLPFYIDFSEGELLSIYCFSEKEGNKLILQKQ